MIITHRNFVVHDYCTQEGFLCVVMTHRKFTAHGMQEGIVEWGCDMHGVGCAW